jgi:2-amino-4-hydroxy-6-hydroxymethyldihydropteridine diphosphokinase
MSPSKPAGTAGSAYLGLGSNLGDRRANLARAVELIGRARDTAVAAASSLYATAPVGLTDQPEFLNAVLEVRTGLEPGELLEACLEIEREMGRVRSVRWGPRIIDIDVLLIDGVAEAGERLILPHPRMTERAFVMVPLAELAAGLVVGGKSAAEWAAVIDATGVRRQAGDWM